jgi:hypothetical protein
MTRKQNIKKSFVFLQFWTWKNFIFWTVSKHSLMYVTVNKLWCFECQQEEDLCTVSKLVFLLLTVQKDNSKYNLGW